MFGNLRKFLENFGNGSKVIFRCFYGFLKFSENLRKSSKVFENLRKFSENFGNGSKVTFRCFYDFLIFSENLWKCSEIFGDIFASEDRKYSTRDPDVLSCGFYEWFIFQ